MSDTIFYRLKLKRNKTPMDVIEKMKKSVKKKGATKNWTCEVDDENEQMFIDFGDGRSETFALSFDDKICDNFCKVNFPLEGELFDDEKKSEFKALLNMIYSAKSCFSEMTIFDDYDLTKEFLEYKKYKFELRELNESEMKHLKNLYDMGYRKHTDLILAIIYEGLEIPFSEDFHEYIDSELSFCTNMYISNSISGFWPLFETYLCETTEYKNQGRVSDIPDYYIEFSELYFSVSAFVLITDALYRFRDYYCERYGAKHTQLIKYYEDKIYPQLDAEGDVFEKCVLAYRFFLSVYEFCGFKFVGKRKDLQMQSLSTAFRSVYENGLMKYGFKKIKGAQPYYVRCIGNEIVHVITFRDWYADNQNDTAIFHKAFDILFGVATVYRRGILFDYPPSFTTEWLKPLSSICYKENYYPAHDPKAYEEMIPYRFEYSGRDEDAMIAEITKSFALTEKYAIPVLDKVTTLEECMRHFFKYTPFILRAQKYFDSPFQSVCGEYDNESFISTKIYGKERAAEYENAWKKAYEELNENELYSINTGMKKITMEQHKENVIKRQKRLKEAIDEFNVFRDTPEWQEKISRELEQRKNNNIEILRECGFEV